MIDTGSCWRSRLEFQCARLEFALRLRESPCLRFVLKFLPELASQLLPAAEDVAPGFQQLLVITFVELRCAVCHAFRGQGAKVGTDLSNSPERDPATAPFNHSPEAAFDDSVLADGVALYAAFALQTLSS